GAHSYPQDLGGRQCLGNPERNLGSAAPVASLLAQRKEPSMLKQVFVATALTCGAAVAYAQTPAPSPSSMPRSNTATAPAVESTGDFNKAGEMAGSALIGAKVHDTSGKETVGSIENIYLDESGKVKVVVMSVGGFLGVGSKEVAVKWEDIKSGKDGGSLALTTGLTKDALKGMPDYKSERQKPAETTGTGKSGG